ncbi:MULTISPECIES: nitric oxide reductase transcriptional regulator NorR [Shewanella]|uniref:Transcriptional regulator, NifA subfamily, Fis family n=2 Tax=Shewanella putrefaciens TaxID=24 RepID=A4YA03_SHEPC|nr:MULTISPECIES: nitric oxide reductase transcriptional regulator NorR [Shewanella]ABM23722.1 transcriptional regulator, NifA subfamily, Fis family [Shewanella sp. W3-18-1]MCA1895591.1 nitric oxide reductase transcriptional regulator NorR [Shewanella putrefaciens]MCK7635946.1 nitric oxide reductase transcriptional regulator NorR [Shewanella sp. JNE17]MCK7651136.1 nitric oxide reductase transcriptional regulator NorR [Shewanella sp. JNE8]MCK7659358.1 nitric oxide reductase transcriptional regul
MALSQTELTRIALDITSGLGHRDRFSRLLDTVRQNLHCNAAALLTFHGQYFTPLAINGLNDDVLGRRFILSEHPRLEAIARAGDIVRFPADSELPDPYDGLIPNQADQLKVHACIGLPLFSNERLIGAVTIDAFDPLQFDQFSNTELRSLSAIAAASLSNALLVEKLERLALNSHASHTEENAPNLNTDGELIGHSPIIQSLNREIEVVAHSDLNVLILGETGTGKELVAQAIHQKSARATKALVYLNCAALPESVAESELFGHVKGAFTGAISHRSGKFEMADKGTLFLDEIGELPLTLQAKLLRVLQYGDLQRVGDDRSLKVDVRIIAATNKVLKTEVLEGRFRADLYHRLSVFPLLVPPLRERGQDITLLSGFFAERYKQKLGIKQLNFSPTSLLLLNQYTWPGNVRELEHAIHRATVLARVSAENGCCTIEPQHFDLPLKLNPLETSQSIATSDVSARETREFLNLTLATESFQSDYIKRVFATQDNNWAATARILGVDPGNLHRLAKRLKLK